MRQRTMTAVAPAIAVLALAFAVSLLGASAEVLPPKSSTKALQKAPNSQKDEKETHQFRGHNAVQSTQEANNVVDHYNKEHKKPHEEHKRRVRMLNYSSMHHAAVEPEGEEQQAPKRVPRRANHSTFSHLRRPQAPSPTTTTTTTERSEDYNEPAPVERALPSKASGAAENKFANDVGVLVGSLVGDAKAQHTAVGVPTDVGAEKKVHKKKGHKNSHKKDVKMHAAETVTAPVAAIHQTVSHRSAGDSIDNPSAVQPQPKKADGIEVFGAGYGLKRLDTDLDAGGDIARAKAQIVERLDRNSESVSSTPWQVAPKHKKKGHKKAHKVPVAVFHARNQSGDPMAALHKEVDQLVDSSPHEKKNTTQEKNTTVFTDSPHVPAASVPEEEHRNGVFNLLNGNSDADGDIERAKAQIAKRLDRESSDGSTTEPTARAAHKKHRRHKKKHHHHQLNNTQSRPPRNMTDPMAEIHEEVASSVASQSSPSPTTKAPVVQVQDGKTGVFKLLPDCSASGNCTKANHTNHSHHHKPKAAKKKLKHPEPTVPPTPPPWDVTLMKHAEAHINNAVSREVKVVVVPTTTPPASFLPDPNDSEDDEGDSDADSLDDAHSQTEDDDEFE